MKPSVDIIYYGISLGFLFYTKLCKFNNMTIEEKAKAYDEALIKAKELLDSPRTCFDINQLKDIFPQLAESEDERIRKGLIEALKASKTVGELKFIFPEPTREECIAYLEKQKDASKAIEAVERIDKYIDQHLANAHDMKDSNPDKKYYRGWDDALGKMAGILQDVYSGEKQKESLRDFIDDFPYSDQKEQKPIVMHTPRYAPPEQKPAEWSEEDRLHYTNVLEALEYVKGCKSDYDKIEAVKSDIAWLKSLRSQARWRPTEEQMHYLELARENYRERHNASVNGDAVFCGLVSLYNNLKKLM